MVPAVRLGRLNFVALLEGKAFQVWRRIKCAIRILPSSFSDPLRLSSKGQMEQPAASKDNENKKRKQTMVFGWRWLTVAARTLAECRQAPMPVVSNFSCNTCLFLGPRRLVLLGEGREYRLINDRSPATPPHGGSTDKACRCETGRWEWTGGVILSLFDRVEQGSLSSLIGW